MREHPPERLRRFPPLSQACSLRAGGRSQRGGAALARLPWWGRARFDTYERRTCSALRKTAANGESSHG